MFWTVGENQLLEVKENTDMEKIWKFPAGISSRDSYGAFFPAEPAP